MNDNDQTPLEDHIARAKVVYDLLQFVRINGGFRAKVRLEAFLGTALGIEQLKDIERAAKRADISKRAAYVEKGLVYGLSLFRNDSGFKFGYIFMCRNDPKPAVDRR